MMTIDKLEERTEKIVEQVRSLSFQFANAELQKEAEDARDEAIDLLESFLELASQDWDERPQTSTDTEDDF